MNNLLKVFDVVDNNIRLNSQVIFNNVGFEIPINYYFDRYNTIIEKNQFQLINDSDFKINITFKVYTKNELDLILNGYKNKNMFKNYREQIIYEDIDNDRIKIFGYDDNMYFELIGNCEKYSQNYYDMYYIAYSFDKIQNEYNNQILQKNNYCILKNAKYVYQKTGINLIYENPYEYLSKIHKINFNEYLTKNKSYFKDLTNYYTRNDFNTIVDKIEKYKSNVVNSDEELMDIIEEV